MRKPFEYIKQAVQIYFKKENFIFFAKVMVILTIVSTSFSLLMGYLYDSQLSSLSDLAGPLQIAGFTFLAILMAVFGVYTRSTTLTSVIWTGADIKNTYLAGWKRMLKYFVATFFVGLIVGLGAIALLIPGVIFGIWYSFTLFLVFEKNLPTFEAMKQSKALVNGRFWKVFGRFMFIGVFMVLVTLVLGYVPYVGSVLISFIAPLYLLPSYLLYKDVSAGQA